MAAVQPWHESINALLLAGRRAQPSRVTDVVNEVFRPLGVEVVVYLIDREQVSLRPLPRSGVPPAEPLVVEASVAGRAFITLDLVAPPGQPDRLWFPIVDDAERLGVMEIQLPGGMDRGDPAVREGVALLGVVIGHLLVAKTAYGDTIRSTRRSREMSTEGEMLWRTLPPLTCVTDAITVAAVLEPCYDVGGDAFDYAIDYENLRVTILDAVGHGLAAALISTLCLAATRAARATGLYLPATAAAADQAISGQFGESRYATAILAELDSANGVLRYINAGHPPAVLIRHGRVVASLETASRPPLGLPAPASMAEQELQPGDRMLFYTDGIIEARNAEGELFGLDRLVDLTERHCAADLPPSETLRRLAHEVLDYQEGVLADDATLLTVEWHPDSNS
jgi:sigma-B regulation protein RsbU (phosphoserine phosphatase)